MNIDELRQKCQQIVDKLTEKYNTYKEKYLLIKETLIIFYQKYLSKLAPLWMWLIPKYKAFFKKHAYVDGVYKPLRGANVIAILSVTTVVALYANVFYIIPKVWEFSYDAVAFNVFSYERKALFSKPEWVSDSGEGDTQLSVFACEEEPCSIDNSIEYRIRDSFYLSIVRTIEKREPYDPGEVAAGMISELNECTVKAYGTRVKYFGWYPYISHAECTRAPTQEEQLTTKG